MRLDVILMLAVAATMAGCLGNDSSTDSETGTTSTRSSSTSSTSATSTGPSGNRTPDEPEVPANEMQMSDCQALTAFLNYPSAIAPGERPDGWGPDSPDNIASVSVYALRCNRIALETYERGPVNLLMDLHGNAAIPPDCAKDANEDHFRILRHLVTDDVELASHLQSKYGVPVLIASFTQAEQDLGGNVLHDTSWAIGGSTPSKVTVIELAATHPNPTLNDRLFWQVGSGVGSLDLQADGNSGQFDPPANGTIQPPMLLASDTGGNFVGNGAWFENLHAQGVFSRYADLECKEPLP